MILNKKRGLVLILLIASILRLWKLNEVPVSLFADELDVGYHAYNIFQTGRDYSGNFLPLHFQSLAEWRTPLYLYSVVPTVAIWGITSWGVRLPAAVFGILGVWGMYLFVLEFGRLGWIGKKFRMEEALALAAAAVLAVSPWHIQYSRAAFEVTMLLSFYLFGLYFFFKSFRDGKWLPVSMILLIATPLIYSTAKLFTPFLLAALFIIFRRDVLNIFFHSGSVSRFVSPVFKRGARKYLILTLLSLLIFGSIAAYATFFSGGTQRFGYISVFTDPTRETEVGVKRELAARFRGETGIGLQPTISDKLFYNKFSFWGQRILKNYFEPFSSEFLFIKGDLNLRHSIEGIGQFYKVEVIALLLGLVLFFGVNKNRKVKIFIAFWVLAGVVPSAITRDGGRHATRLIIVLPPLIFLAAYGLVDFCFKANSKRRLFFATCYILLFSINFVFYQKNYWTENPWYSERWWHSGYKEAIQSVKAMESEYDIVLITDKNEPPWIFFGSYMTYDAETWQQVKPDANWIDHEIYGRVTAIDKYIFGSPPDANMYDWGKSLGGSTLFLASEKEVGINLIKEPERTPGDLMLIKSITYPSGEPAFYFFKKR